MKFSLLVALFCGLVPYLAIGQNKHAQLQKEDNVTVTIDSVAFCKVLGQLLADAPGNFEKEKGNVIETTSTGMIYSTNRGLPGAITSSIILEKEWSYDGVIYQGQSKGGLEKAYYACKNVLDACLVSIGFTRNTNNNEGKGLEKYPVVRYSKPNVAGPVVMLKLENSDFNALYTVSVVVSSK